MASHLLRHFELPAVLKISGHAGRAEAVAGNFCRHAGCWDQRNGERVKGNTNSVPCTKLFALTIRDSSLFRSFDPIVTAVLKQEGLCFQNRCNVLVGIAQRNGGHRYSGCYYV